MPATPRLSVPMQILQSPVAQLTVLLMALLLMNFVLQLPTWQVADWGQFAFYDPGTVLKGDVLLAKGYRPTIEFGYTHGLLSLLYGRVGFAILGRTPWAFLLLTLITEGVMAWAMARILVACRVGIPALVVLCVALPMTIMPAYLTLTHPLEAMLILLALAAQAEGRRAQALAILTTCLFVKPSMAYVYGFVLLVLILWREWPRANWARHLVPALLTLVILFTGLSMWMGLHPVVMTLLPATGAKTYAATGFGFFAASGRAFWLRGTLSEEFLTPAAAFLLATVATLVGACSMIRLPRLTAAHELLLTVGILQGAFLAGFYGWTGSWTYYAYVPAIGLALTLTLLSLKRPHRLALAGALCLVLLISHHQLVGDIYNGWHFKLRNQATDDLWADPEVFEQFQEALVATGRRPTLLMSNGYLAHLPPTVELPDAWFPEPGIPTPPEIARVKAQAERAQCVIIWWEYRAFDLWNTPDFADVRSKFQPLFKNARFTVFARSHE